MTLAMNAQRELCVVQKAGGVPMAVDEILRLVGMGAVVVFFEYGSCCSHVFFAEVGVQKVKELDVLVEEALREDWKGRRVEVQ
jgi:exosome complex component RRP45